jgi:hypothetical protein
LNATIRLKMTHQHMAAEILLRKQPNQQETFTTLDGGKREFVEPNRQPIPIHSGSGKHVRMMNSAAGLRAADLT